MVHYVLDTKIKHYYRSKMLSIMDPNLLTHRRKEHLGEVWERVLGAVTQCLLVL